MPLPILPLLVLGGGALAALAMSGKSAPAASPAPAAGPPPAPLPPTAPPGPVVQPPTTPSKPLIVGSGDIDAVPEVARAAVQSAIDKGTDPTVLDALAVQMDGQGFPAVAQKLRARAATMRGGSVVHDMVNVPTTVAPPLFTPAAPPAPMVPFGGPTAPAAPAVVLPPVPAVFNDTHASTTSTALPPPPFAAPAALTSPAAPAPPPTFSYTIKPGDSAWAIANRYAGDGNRWKEFMAFNPGLRLDGQGRPSPFNPGQTIQLPGSWAGTATVSAPAVAAPAAPAAPSYAPMAVAPVGPTAPAAPAAPAAPVPPRTYTIRPGDSAWAIASKYAGAGSRWKELLAVNANLHLDSGGNPSPFNPGQTLVLPASWTASA